MKKIEWITVMKRAGGSALVAIMGMVAAVLVVACLVSFELLELGIARRVLPWLCAAGVGIYAYHNGRRSGHGRVIVAMLAAVIVVSILLFVRQLLFATASGVNWRGVMLCLLLSVPAGVLSCQRKTRKR